MGVLVNYFDRVNLSVSHSGLYATFGISDITFGYLLGAYNWTYAMCQLPIGVVLDRFGIKLVGRISTFLWSMASFAAALTPSIGGFFAARFLLGVGEAPTFPANAKAIGYWFPPRERSLATSIFDSMAKFSSAIGVPLIGILLLHVGWRLSFAATGTISFLYFLFFFWIYRDPKDDPGLTSEELSYIRSEDTLPNVESGPLEQASLGYLLRRKKVIGLAIGFGSYNYVFYLLLTWLPSYLSRSLHIDLLHSFLYTGVPWLFATIADLVVGGWIVDALVQRGWNANIVRRVVLIGGTALGLGILGGAHAHSPAQALFWISVSISGLSAAAPVGWSIPSLIAPRASVGTLGGILNFANQISGIAAPIVTGYLVEARHSFALAFAVAAVYLAVGICSYLFLLGDIKRILGEAHLAV
ncbi:MFS transporter [Alloacidobacterium sp.]|uniref:MFS transporter n=1 Tax=Alloacidobacterium sp. TaxID=2951999 RepID=UPI002D65B11B|nr:MFS transporter [Alloacidobacterium sp.]HYK36457.1 MFS transporter [Alloacidobacterium sp.]